MSREVIVYGKPEARFPVNYEEARTKIQICASIDECKDWADIGAAMASWAAQRDDPIMFDCAKRIRARAVKEIGQRSEGMSLKRAAAMARAKESFIVTARQVGRVAEKKFSEVIENRSPPMALSKFAKLGSNPIGEDRSAPIWKMLERLTKLSKEFPAEVLTASVLSTTSEEAIAVRHLLTPCVEWLDAVDASADARIKQGKRG